MSMIPNDYFRATAALGIELGEKPKWIATGFFVAKKQNNESFSTYLVTNKHVCELSDSLCVRMYSRKTNEINKYALPLNEGAGHSYFIHPNCNTDIKIDVAVIPINAGIIVHNDIDCFFIDIDKYALTSEQLSLSGFSEGSLLYMLGYPMGLVNVDSLLPVCRIGCMARMSGTQLKENNNYLLDIQNFPGNSGSPIFSRPEVACIDGSKTLTRCVLIGIINSYIPYCTQLYDAHTGKLAEIREENSGIAKAFPVEYIKETINSAESVLFSK